jgi:DUF1365 family protein
MILNSAIYDGTVVHERVRPKRHHLRYDVFTMLLDLDELPELDRRFRLFGYNRGAVFSFYDKDHGATTGADLRSKPAWPKQACTTTVFPSVCSAIPAYSDTPSIRSASISAITGPAR